MTAADFARDELQDYTTYTALAQQETNQDFKKILEDLIRAEWEHYNFWLGLSGEKKVSIKKWKVFLMLRARSVLGLTFVARMLEGDEQRAIANYTEFLKTAPADVRDKVQGIIEHETTHEARLIQQIKEEKVEFISSIILGINDGIIELTGALVGFSFAFTSPFTVALSGLITGIAASLSMSASAYMQASHDTHGKDPVKSALYTGISYGVVVALLVIPYFVIPVRFGALSLMFVIVLIIIVLISYYTAVIFRRRFIKQLGTMLLFSLGVAAISFAIGMSFQKLLGGSL